jgi:lipopolysaccharide export system permease protein
VTVVLANYLRRRVGGQTLALLIVLTALMQVVELMDVATDILDRALGTTGILYYILLRTPSEVVLALPLSMLLGAMSTFYSMARSNEITAIRSAGVGLNRFVLYLLPIPALLAVLQFALSEHVVPRAETELKRWWDATATTPWESAPVRRWVHTSTGPLSFDGTSPDGHRLRDVRIYLRGPDGLFYRRISARTAQWDGREWRLEQIDDVSVSGRRYSRSSEAGRIWNTNLRPDDVQRLDVPQPHLSSVMLADVIAGRRVGAQPLSYYQTVLYRSFTAPLGAFVMLLLAVPPARAMSRGGGGGDLLLALGLGLGFLLCDGLMSALGTSGRVPAAAAVAAAPVMFTAVGFFILRSRT